MVVHGGSSAGSYLADPTSPIPSHCASIVATSTLKVNCLQLACVVVITKKNLNLLYHHDICVAYIALINHYA